MTAPTLPGARVRFVDVERHYGSARALDGVSFDVAPGEFIALLGPSGCGKTTALRALSGLERIDAGRILVDEEDVAHVPVAKRDMGMVFQSYSLFPHLRARENVEFGLRTRGVGARERRASAGEALDVVGLGALGDRYAHELSGGQQQRVALARALVTRPRVLLLDEPLSALDAKVRVQLRDEIRRIQLRLGTTTVFVTHDQEEALAVSDRIAVMNAGRIEQIGTPEDLYLRPETPGVAAFVGLSSVVPAIVSGGIASVLGATVPVVGEVADGEAEAFIRPENVRLGGPIAAVVQESTFLGSMRRTLVRTEQGAQLWLQHPVAERLGFDERVTVGIEPVPVVVRPRG